MIPRDKEFAKNTMVCSNLSPFGRNSNANRRPHNEDPHFVEQAYGVVNAVNATVAPTPIHYYSTSMNTVGVSCTV